MTITIKGRHGESKTCVANLIRQALENVGILAEGFGDGEIPYFDGIDAKNMMGEGLEVKILEEKKV